MTPSSPSPARAGEAVLPSGSRFEGLLVLPHDACVDGALRGKVIAHGSLRVGTSGRIEANLEASEILIEGRVRGDLSASHRITLGSDARVEGDLETPRLAVHEGAQVQGRCRTGLPDPA